jgi:hypothetical protein
VDGWSSEENDPPPRPRAARDERDDQTGTEETILVGDRTMRVRRRRTSRVRPRLLPVVAVLLILAAVAIGAIAYLNRPTGLDAVAGPAIVAAGAFQAKVGADGTITVALEIRNVTDAPVTVVDARVIAPSGLMQVALTVLAPGEQNRNLNLEGPLPAAEPITLGTTGIDRNGVVAARYRVTCDSLPPTASATGEQIFVTVRVGEEEREEQVTPPVVNGTPWLTATARSACVRPSVTGSLPPPLPPPLPPLSPSTGPQTPPAP